MTWLEFKRRAEILGVLDSDEIEVDEITDDGIALFPDGSIARIVPKERFHGYPKVRGKV